MRFLRSCLKLSADKISSAALAFINGKDQLHVMPKNPEHRIIENRRIEGLTPVSSFRVPVSSFGSAIEMVEGSEPYRLTWSNMPAAQITGIFLPHNAANNSKLQRFVFRIRLRCAEVRSLSQDSKQNEWTGCTNADKNNLYPPSRASNLGVRYLFLSKARYISSSSQSSH